MNNLQQRKEIIRVNQMPRFDVVRAVSDTVSNGVRYAAKAELLQEQLTSFIVQLYEKDSTGQHINIDPFDGRLLVKVPWRKGAKGERFTLRSTERTVLRAILREEQMNEQRIPLFIFDLPRWYLSIGSYRNTTQAMAWVDAIRLDAAKFNRFDSMRRDGQRKASAIQSDG